MGFPSVCQANVPTGLLTFPSNTGYKLGVFEGYGALNFFPESDSREIRALLASSAKRPEEHGPMFWEFMMREIMSAVLRDR